MESGHNNDDNPDLFGAPMYCHSHSLSFQGILKDVRVWNGCVTEQGLCLKRKKYTKMAFYRQTFYLIK